MKLVKANEFDSDKLCDFLKKSLYPNKINLMIHRPQGFFAPYLIHSRDYVTYYLVDKNNEIQAMASLLFKKVKLYGEEQTVGYATDLRVGSQKAILNWTKHFLPALEKERDERNCKYIFSTINKYQNDAYKSFLRPRSKRRVMPRYYLFRKFNVSTIHGILPFAPKTLKNLNIRRANVDDLEALQAYICKKQTHRPIAEINRCSDLKQIFCDWPNFLISDFMIALDFKDKIVGCMSLWDGSVLQSYEPKKYHQKAMTFKQTLNFLSFLRSGRRLPKKNEKLNMIQLSHIYVDNPDIHYSLLRSAWEKTPRTHFLTYAHFESELATQVPRSFIHTNTGYGLYCILTPNDPIPDFLTPTYLGEAPDFEFAYI